MIELFGVFLLALAVITAIGVVQARNLFAGVMLMGIFSLLMAATFFLLDAADVALTEAAVGAGISTVLMLSALALSGAEEKARSRSRILALIVVTVTAATVIYATFEKPRLGDPNAPVQQHVAPWYFDMTQEAIEIPNVVTAVLSSFRGYDTLGEVIVVFTAGIGVLFLIGAAAPKGRASPSQGDLPVGLKHHQPIRVVGKLAIPFILLFAFYVQFHGEYSPGGGFQAGALFAAAIILYGMLEGEATALSIIPAPVLFAMSAGGALLFGGVGVVCMLLGGNFLQYDVLLAGSPVGAQQMGIIAIELGVGITVAGTLLSIFFAFATRDQS
ncbi:MAG: DUF4040 domain-containing protein [Xanthomonadales bacterium]|nr:DUF4040 domain-containing protein [Xanthomonadales bacterium]